MKIMKMMKKTNLKKTVTNNSELLEIRKKANKMVIQHSSGAAVVGFVPIPFSDAPILLANQGGLVVRLAHLYGLDDLSDKAFAVLSGIGIGQFISAMGIKASGYIASQALKFLPGIGTVTGGIINAGVASTITASIGLSVSELFYRISLLKLKGDKYELENYINGMDSEFLKIFKEVVRRNLSKKKK